MPDRTATIIASRFGSTPVADPARHREVGRGHERLDLEQQRPRPLERAGDRRADLARPRATEELGRIGHADEPAARHLEDAELVRRAEPVLRRPQDAMRVVAVALELEHAVDEVLEHAWARDRAVLRHVPDEDRRDARLLRHAQQARRRLPHLRDRAGRRAELGRVQRLHGVDHADVGPLALERGAHTSRARSRRGSRRRSVPPSRVARSFTWATDSSPVTSSARRPPAATAPSAESSSVDFPTPGSPPTSTSDAGTMPPPSTRSSSATPSGSAPPRPPRPRRGAAEHAAAARRRLAAAQLLDERAERAAPGAPPEPAPRGGPALATAVLDDDLGHRRR